jgi:hypothetical protein
MSEDRRQILQMLAEGKVNADEAERLIAALEGSGRAVSAPAGPSPGTSRPNYLRVIVDAEDKHQPGKPVKVNIRVPMQLLRAGMRFGAMIPPAAKEKVNEALQKQGIGFDLDQMKPENLEALVDQLNDLTVDVDQEGTKVRVFCE